MFYLVSFYKYLLLLISVLMFLYGLLHLFSKDAFFRIKYVLLLRPDRKKSRLRCLILVLVFLLNCFFIPFNERKQASAVISLNYPEASQGLNPNGTRYNQVDILDTEVLENTIRRGALKEVTVEDLKKTLRVQPKVQGDSYNQESYFISTQFVLSYQADQSTMHLDGDKLTALVAETYKQWFLQQYSDNVTAFDLNFDRMEQEDYLDICKYLKKEADKIGAYMMNMSYRESAFQSDENRETFQSVAARAYNVSDVMIENLEAYVLENGISKETPTYMGRLGFQNAFLYFDSLKADRASRNNLEAISLYEDEMARIVLVPTYDTDSQFYMSQTRIGIDDFAAEADGYANRKTEIDSQIALNNHIFQQLSQANEADGRDEKAEGLIGQIEEELVKLAKEARTLVEEYSISQTDEYITVIPGTWENQISRIMRKILLYTGLFAVGMYCAAIVHALESGEEKRRSRA